MGIRRFQIHISFPGQPEPLLREKSQVFFVAVANLQQNVVNKQTRPNKEILFLLVHDT
jgi:hypothetical protein